MLAAIPAIFLVPVGWIVVLPLLTVIFTTRRVRETQEWITRGGSQINPFLTILLAILFWSHSVYVQKALNEAWLGAKNGEGPPPTAKPTVLEADDVMTASEARDDAVNISKRIGRG